VRLLGAAFALHDVRDVEAHVRALLDARLREWGARLRPNEYEDALSYLIDKCWELSRVYDPTLGLSFSTYSRRILTARVVDWYRTTYGDARYGTQHRHVSLEGLAARFEREGEAPEQFLDQHYPGREDTDTEEVLIHVALGL
jgi:hypothetical protein